MKILSFAALISAFLLLPGCGNTDENRAPSGSYTVRGIITQLPSNNPTSALLIEHEAIPDYKSPTGETGMPIMNMEFQPAPGVSLDGYAIGDKVEFTYETFFDKDPIKSHLRNLRKLPADTTLNLEPDPNAAPHDHHHHHHGHDHDHSQ